MPQIAELVQLWKEAYGVAKEATSVLNGKGPLLTSWAVCFDMFWNALLRYLICSTLTQDVISSALCLQAFTHFFEDNLIGAMNQSMVFIFEDIGWLRFQQPVKIHYPDAVWPRMKDLIWYQVGKHHDAVQPRVAIQLKWDKWPWRCSAEGRLTSNSTVHYELFICQWGKFVLLFNGHI